MILNSSEIIVYNDIDINQYRINYAEFSEVHISISQPVVSILFIQ